GFDELTEFVELCDHVLAGLPQLLGDRADAGLACHLSPHGEAERRVRAASTSWVCCSSPELHSVLTMGRPRFLALGHRRGVRAVSTDPLPARGRDSAGPA